ncbi:uncharacterized protein LOC119908710 isoform X3 [Micropterus salmoides]|uniref:uncharacterized protein LOC119908710 isoform X3 n=1 Tax=Micropterus salmoides TaxID=27706 RepID=UPI0018ED3D7A|nr:uncharacterized protein LOC119908710 isoform X3 [Micropterus salmoides]
MKYVLFWFLLRSTCSSKCENERQKRKETDRRTMVEFRWIKMFLCLILVLQFTAVSEQHHPSLIVSKGDEVTLPCENVQNDHRKCNSTAWHISGCPGKSERNRVMQGQIVTPNTKGKSDRLSVAENCSLVIKNITVEDVGRYYCQQFRSGQQQGPDSQVYLSVVNMTEHKDADKVTLNCSVSTYEHCRHTVKLLYGGTEVDKHNEELRMDQSYCWASVIFKTSHFIHKSQELLKCKVTDSYNGKVYTFSPQSSVKKTGANKTAPGNNNETTKPQDWLWLYITVSVGLAALFITVVALIRWKRNKGNKKTKKTQIDENMGVRLNPAVTEFAPETNQDMADPEDGVSYTSICFTEKTNKEKVRVQGGDDAVTYSIVKAPSSSAGASADPRNLYATIK